MTLKLQEEANFGMFFHVMQTINIVFMFVYDKNKDTPLWTGSIEVINHIDWVSFLQV